MIYIGTKIFSRSWTRFAEFARHLMKTKQARKVERLEGRRHMSHTDLPEIWYDNKTGNVYSTSVISRLVRVTIHALDKQ